MRSYDKEALRRNEASQEYAEKGTKLRAHGRRAYHRDGVPEPMQ